MAEVTVASSPETFPIESAEAPAESLQSARDHHALSSADLRLHDRPVLQLPTPCVKYEGFHTSSKAFTGTPNPPKDLGFKPQRPSNHTTITTKFGPQTTIQPVLKAP